MSGTPDTPPAGKPSAEPGKLEDLDKLLEQEDPGFGQALAAVRAVVVESSVQIDSEGASVELEVAEEQAIAAKGIKPWLVRRKLNLQAQIRRLKASIIIFIKTVPKEFALFLLATLKRFGGVLKAVLKEFGHLSKMQKLSVLVLGLMSVLTVGIVMKNLKGHWLPSLLPPILMSLSDIADNSFEFDPKETVPFFKAFPQDPELFLFPRIKVNLRRSPEHPNPMGAFEVYVQIDSHDTAIEIQSRQTELFDVVQRTFEGLSYTDLETETGKGRAKMVLKRDLSKQLTQGWVTDVHFKMFILKP
jgi:flagellar basal body-associated protein FliL